MVRTGRRCLVAAFAALAVLGVTSGACAQCTTPDCLYVFIVPGSAGGLSDVVGRVIGQSLAKRINVRVVVESRPGASGMLATQMVANAKADGSTLLMLDASTVVGATLLQRSDFNPLRDIAPVATVASVPFVVLASPSLPVKTVPELVAYAKANPQKINVASTGIGSPSHLAEELFNAMTGANLVHVPYRGAAPALSELLAGQVQLSFLPLTAVIGPIREGAIRPLAVTGAKRSELLPDVPALAEFVPGYDAGSWIGFGAPIKTPAAVVDRINSEINGALDDAEVRAQLAKLGASTLRGSPVAFKQLIQADTEKWTALIRQANIKAQ